MFGPANAMGPMTCDEATMTKMQSDMDAMSDPAMKMNKDMAMKQMDMAKMSMKDKKMEDCSAQLGMASMSMTMKCDDASMAMMKTEMDAMKDPAMKNSAMKNLELAGASMKDNKNEECMMHMGAAMDAMHKKM
jgi:hypothetical protein